MLNSRQPRPWQFSLRAILVVVTFVATGLGIAHYCLTEADLLRLVLGVAVLVPVAVAMTCLFFVPLLAVISWLDRRSKRR